MIYNSGTKIIKVGNINKISDQNQTVFQYIKADSPTPPHDYSQDYLTFEALESGTFRFSGNSVNYSLDDGATWTSLAANTSTPTVSAGEKIMFKASITPDVDSGVGRFSSTGNYNAMGNPYSLIDGDNFSGMTASTAYALYGLFEGCNGLVSAENLSLQAQLAGYDYTYMFSGCTSLVNAPELPATGAAFHCYDGMFAGCTSLTTAPEVQFTSLATYCCQEMFMGCTSLTSVQSVLSSTIMFNSCYYRMFRGCTSLTTAPELPATSLSHSATGCYSEMFYGCSSLNYIKCLVFDEYPEGMTGSCMQYWVYGVAPSGTFVKNASMTWPTGNSGIPTGWTVQDNV